MTGPNVFDVMKMNAANKAHRDTQNFNKNNKIKELEKTRGEKNMTEQEQMLNKVETDNKQAQEGMKEKMQEKQERYKVLVSEVEEELKALETEQGIFSEKKFVLVVENFMGDGLLKLNIIERINTYNGKVTLLLSTSLALTNQKIPVLLPLTGFVSRTFTTINCKNLQLILSTKEGQQGLNDLMDANFIRLRTQIQEQLEAMKARMKLMEGMPSKAPTGTQGAPSIIS